MTRLVAMTLMLAGKLIRRLRMFCCRALFKKTGSNFVFDPSDRFSWNSITVGDDVYVGPGAHFSAIKGLKIGDRVMFGPNVTIMGGNHNSELNGLAMRFNHLKRDLDDEPVSIECDSWVGAGATILKGVTVGRGAIVGAQSVVTRNVPPYAIVAGCPAKVMKFRGTLDEVKVHEAALYTQSQRLSDRQLKHLEGDVER